MKAPLIIMTTVFSLAFLDGAFAMGLTDGFYAVAGFAALGALVWMWIIEAR